VLDCFSICFMHLVLPSEAALIPCLLHILQIVGLCQALNDVLDSMAKKGLSIPVWSAFFFYMASYKIKMDCLAYMCSKAEKLISHGFLIIFVKLKYFGSFICLFIVSIINIHWAAQLTAIWSFIVNVNLFFPIVPFLARGIPVSASPPLKTLRHSDFTFFWSFKIFLLRLLIFFLILTCCTVLT